MWSETSERFYCEKYHNHTPMSIKSSWLVRMFLSAWMLSTNLFNHRMKVHLRYSRETPNTSLWNWMVELITSLLTIWSQHMLTFYFNHSPLGYLLLPHVPVLLTRCPQELDIQVHFPDRLMEIVSVSLFNSTIDDKLFWVVQSNNCIVFSQRSSILSRMV